MFANLNVNNESDTDTKINNIPKTKSININKKDRISRVESKEFIIDTVNWDSKNENDKSLVNPNSVPRSENVNDKNSNGLISDSKSKNSFKSSTKGSRSTK